MTKKKEATKLRYTDEEFEEFDLLIVEKLNEANKQLAFYKQQMSDLSTDSDSKAKAFDDVSGSMEIERINDLMSRTEKYILHLENARLRIQNKVYGICRETGKLISKERLKAVPHATLSIEAKQSK